MRRHGWFLLLALGGCEVVPPESMADVVFPPGVVLDSHRSVAVILDTSPAAVDGWFLRLEAPGEGVLYEGSASFAAAFGVELRLRPDVDHLTAELRGPPRTVTLEVPITADGTAVVRP